MHIICVYPEKEANFRAVPMNTLKEAGTDLFSLAQNTPDFFRWYKPGSIIIGLTLENLENRIGNGKLLYSSHQRQDLFASKRERSYETIVKW